MSQQFTALEVQNALRVLTHILHRDEELVFCGNDLILFRDHLYRTQELAPMLLESRPNTFPALSGAGLLDQTKKPPGGDQTTGQQLRNDQ